MRQEDFLACAMGMERTLYRVAKTLLRQDADCADAVQDALLKGIAHCHTIREEAFVKTWLTRILINTCKDMLRKIARHPVQELSEDYPAPQDGRVIYEALRDLPEELRLPLILHYLEGFPVRDVADMLRLPEGTVKRRLWNGRKQLRELLTQEAI